MVDVLTTFLMVRSAMGRTGLTFFTSSAPFFDTSGDGPEMRQGVWRF
jgi:hypothetical protein